MESQIGCPDPHPGKRLASDAAPDQNFWSADISQKFLQNKKSDRCSKKVSGRW
jgi:hypothetical protein